MQREPLTSPQHLTEGDLFTLAVPPAGEPEALPRHLSECSSCSRALSEWKTAERDRHVVPTGAAGVGSARGAHPRSDSRDARGREPAARMVGGGRRRGYPPL